MEGKAPIDPLFPSVTPAYAGVHRQARRGGWIPAFAGMEGKAPIDPLFPSVTPAYAGVHPLRWAGGTAHWIPSPRRGNFAAIRRPISLAQPRGTRVRMQLDEILERNQEFVRGRTPRPLPPAAAVPLAVVGCYDPRLDDLLRPALGVGPGEAILLRAAGARLAPGGDPLRSLGLAAFLFGIAEIVVVGHTSCRMAMFDVNAFIEAFRRRGLTRDAFGPEDLRAWAGAIASPRAGVLESVAAIHSAPFMPKDIAVSGLILNDETGALEVVVRPGEVVVAATPAPAMPEGPVSSAAPAVEPAAVAPARRDAAPAAPAPSAPARAAEPDAPLAPRFDDRQINSPEVRELLGSLGEMLQHIQWKGRWQGEVQTLRQELSRTANPFKRLQLLEDFYRRAAVESREVAAAYQELRRRAAGVKAAATPQTLSDILRVLTGGGK